MTLSFFNRAGDSRTATIDAAQLNRDRHVIRAYLDGPAPDSDHGLFKKAVAAILEAATVDRSTADALYANIHPFLLAAAETANKAKVEAARAAVSEIIWSRASRIVAR